MDTRTKKYLEDIRTAIESIESHLGNQRSFGQFESVRIMLRATERELVIVGEALLRISEMQLDIALNDVDVFVALRKQLIESYNDTDLNHLWKVTNEKIPVLYNQVCDILEQV